MGFKYKIYDQSQIYFKAEGLEGVVANYNFECAKLQTSHNRLGNFTYARPMPQPEMSEGVTNT